jgi:signal transduction histidine kinase/CHASE3 domain sensor protein/CheY-like chemotaxis protein
MAGFLTRRPGGAALARPAFGIVLIMVLMMAAAGVASVRILDSLEQLHDSATRASAEATAADIVLDSLQDSETGVRGYLLTMRQDYLDPYLASRGKMEEALHRLEMLADGSPWLRAEIGTLRADAEARMAEIDRTLAIDRAAGQDAALGVILTDQGRREMASVHASCDRILQHANTEREEHTAELFARAKQTMYVVMAAALTGTLLLGFEALGLLVGRTRLVWAQSALSTQSSRLQGTVDHIRDGVAVFDATDRLILWNPSFFPIAGLPTALAVLGTPFARFAEAASGWDPPLLAGPRPEAGAAQTADAEIRVGEKVLEVWRSLMPDGGHILAVTDITRRTRAEAIARQAQKMEALGQLTGGVAHDFNNLLQVISANLELVDTRLPSDGADATWLRARLAAARSGVDRGARLVRHLLAFARRQPLAPQVTDPGRLLRGMEEMLRRALGPSARLELTMPEQAWPVRVDPQQLESALLNLAINGRDAIGAAGRDGPALLRIALSNVTLDAAAASQLGLGAGEYVRLAVTDRGAGMSEATIARAVEPFFTTKGDGKGTGLGLPMVYGFARQSGGAMKIDSVPGQGTTVALLIPRTTEPAVAPPPTDSAPPRATPSSPPSQLIVVAEDDPAVRVTTVELLGGFGHQVQQAGTAAEALALLDRDTDLLISDIGLPDMDGRDLAYRALGTNPGLTVILASGRVPSPMPDDPRIVWLPKPYTARSLAAAIASVTGEVAG